MAYSTVFLRVIPRRSAGCTLLQPARDLRLTGTVGSIGHRTVFLQSESKTGCCMPAGLTLIIMVKRFYQINTVIEPSWNMTEGYETVVKSQVMLFTG